MLFKQSGCLLLSNNFPVRSLYKVDRRQLQLLLFRR